MSHIIIIVASFIIGGVVGSQVYKRGIERGIEMGRDQAIMEEMIRMDNDPMKEQLEAAIRQEYVNAQHKYAR